MSIDFLYSNKLSHKLWHWVLLGNAALGAATLSRSLFAPRLLLALPVFIVWTTSITTFPPLPAQAHHEENYKKGEAYNKDKKYALAIPWLTKAIDANPKSAECYVQRGVAYTGIGAFDEAIADLKHAIKLEPNMLKAHEVLADTYHQTGALKECLAENNESLRGPS